ncbi:MAG: ribonuclease III [Bacteroidaceae bacterium]|nr:ribonuclease III [Bacteroidaceae bacterium]MBR3734200.1 ribonuclease III [Bacteroidaceae bacterium]
MNNILYRIKFLFRKKGEFFASIEKIVGFTPRHIEYYRQALTHRSASVRDAKGHKADNERLEYLGDAVIETVISDILYHQYPKRDEGFLSTMRSKLVERKNLGRIAKEIGLLPLLRTDFKDGSRPTTHNSYLGGNAFEALVGAIYLDRGFRGSFRFIRRLMDQGYIDIARTARVEENHKSLLLEWGQKYKADVRFFLKSEDRSSSRGTKFCYAVMVEGREIATATGYSKKECHQLAAKRALSAFRRNPNFERSMLQMRLTHRVVKDLMPYAQPTKEKEE